MVSENWRIKYHFHWIYFILTSSDAPPPFFVRYSSSLICPSQRCHVRLHGGYKDTIRYDGAEYSNGYYSAFSASFTLSLYDDPSFASDYGDNNGGPSATSTSSRKGKKGLSFLLGAFGEGGGAVGGEGGDGVEGGKRVPRGHSRYGRHGQRGRRSSVLPGSVFFVCNIDTDPVRV